MFRFYRSNKKYPLTPNVIPIELNVFDSETSDFKFIGYSDYASHISLRSFYISKEGNVIVRYANSSSDNPHWEKDHNDEKLPDVVQIFFERVFTTILGLR